MPTNDIPNSELHVLLPFFDDDDDKEIPTEKYNPVTTELLINKRQIAYIKQHLETGRKKKSFTTTLRHHI